MLSLRFFRFILLGLIINIHLIAGAQFKENKSDPNETKKSVVFIQPKDKDLQGVLDVFRQQTQSQAAAEETLMRIGRQLQEMEDLHRLGQGLAVCGDHPKVCQNYLSMMRTLDKEDTNIVFLKGIFTDALGKPWGISGINAPFKMAPAENSCKKVDDKYFPTAKSILDWLQSLPTERSRMDERFFIERCVNQFGLTEEKRKDYLIKYMSINAKIRHAIALAQARMAKITNEISIPSIEEVKNRCQGSSSYLVKQCVDESECSLHGVRDQLLEQESKNICRGVPREILDSYQKELTESSGLRKKVVCLTAMKKYINAVKGQKVLKDEKKTASGAEAEDTMEMLGVSVDPELLLLDPRESIEKNFQRVVDQKKDEKDHLKNYIEKLNLVDNCLHGFISDPKKCNAQDAYDLMQEQNLVPSVVNISGISLFKPDQKGRVLIEHLKRQDCLYQSRFDQQVQAALTAGLIQDATLLIIPVGGPLFAAARFAQGIKGLRLVKGLAAVVNNSKAGGVVMTSLGLLPSIDGWAAAYSSCLSNLAYQVRSGVSGKVNMKYSTCNISEIKMEQDRKQCEREVFVAALGFPWIGTGLSKLGGKAVSALSPKKVPSTVSTHAIESSVGAGIGAVGLGTGVNLYIIRSENKNKAESSVINIDLRPLKFPDKNESGQSQ